MALLAADTLGSRVCVFTRAGKFVRTLGARAARFGRPRAPGSFHLPRNVAIVRGHLLVVEDCRLQVLTLMGEVRQVIEFAASDGLAPACAGTGVRVSHADEPTSKPSSPQSAEGAREEGPAQLWGIAADSERVYVSDAARHRLHVFNLRGAPN